MNAASFGFGGRAAVGWEAVSPATADKRRIHDPEAHPRPALQSPVPCLRRPSRQHGRLGVQGIHLRRAVPEAAVGPVRPGPRSPAEHPARARDAGAAGPGPAREPRSVRLLRSGGGPLEPPRPGRRAGLPHRGEEGRRRPGRRGTTTAWHQPPEDQRRQLPQQGTGGAGGGQPRYLGGRAQAHQLQPQDRPAHARRRYPGRFHPELREDPAARRELRVPGPARRGLRIPDQVLRRFRRQEGGRVLHPGRSGTRLGGNRRSAARHERVRPDLRVRRHVDPDPRLHQRERRQPARPGAGRPGQHRHHLVDLQDEHVAARHRPRRHPPGRHPQAPAAQG